MRIKTARHLYQLVFKLKDGRILMRLPRNTDITDFLATQKQREIKGIVG